MKIVKIARALTIAVALSMLSAGAARAEEARPWLCRDKPVFSYDKPMQYQVTAHSGRQWRVFFMQYSPDAAHDGFDIVNTRDITSQGIAESGNLTAGRYFAVALYRSGGHWICPGYTHDDRDPTRGEVSNLCYGEEGPPCLVNLKVKSSGN